MSICSGIFDDERLIELVENHEILYNKHCTGYKGAGEKTESWIKIGEELGLTAEECAKRWKSLRERYSRELKLVENNNNYVVEWPLFGALSFLRQFVKQRQGRSTLNEVNDELLIQLVRDHHVLYQKSCLGLTSSSQKADAWFEISEQMGITAEGCSSRWRSLRERYTRELKQAEMLSESNDDASLCVQWPLFNSLSFLRDSVKPRHTRDSKDSAIVTIKRKRRKLVCTDHNEVSGACNSPTLVCKKEFFIDTMSMPPDNELFARTIEDCREKMIIPNGNQEKFFESPESCRNNITTAKTNDSINLFGQTVAAIISEMSQAKQAKAMRVLFNALITIKTEPEES
ncbi:uncharacterized protein LOC105227756 [Bactrocera dorsalis]|uniref:Uncharacterized protein LOC105227756 n=1 Tax=Bactrocera dorsalis TaxID=27457 RepID=A0A6I9V9K3_BACDO|nr:uncharacterized protein LOC105227756 [Bactrocera dorsalis]